MRSSLRWAWYWYR